MPLTKSAIKKIRVDERRHAINIARMSKLRTLVKKAKAEKSFESISAAYAALDKAVKVNMVHRNFANRNKAQLGRLAKPEKLSITKTVTVKGSTKKAAGVKTTATKVKTSKTSSKSTASIKSSKAKS